MFKIVKFRMGKKFDSRAFTGYIGTLDDIIWSFSETGKEVKVKYTSPDTVIVKMKNVYTIELQREK